MVSPARSGPGRLVCSDCGAPMDAHLHQEHPPWGWPQFALLLGVVAIGFCAIGAVWIGDQTNGDPLELDAPATEQQGEAKE